MIKKNYIFLSIFAAIVTINLKLIAYFVTGSIGLLSDAVESFVNLTTAIFAFLILKLAEKPADENHPFGHSKAEYFSSFFEGGLIFLAAIFIAVGAGQRLVAPQPLEKVSLGLFISFTASLVNLFVGLKLINVGKKYGSITLEANGHHLLTDIYTSAGVIVAVFLVEKTKIFLLDPLVALAVGLNILKTGFSLIKKSALGLMDTSLSKNDLQKIKTIWQKYEKRGFFFHQLQTRQSGQKKFISFHLLFPNHWSIKKAHDQANIIEKEIKKKITNAVIFTHLEPIRDMKSYDN